jgi:acyl carrier protein
MSDLSEQIRAFVVNHLKETAETQGITGLQIDGDFELFESGVLDSFAFINLLGVVEDQFNVELDPGDGGPERFSTLDGLLNSLVPVESSQVRWG